ncbi:hypothetical protein DFA_06417 [Cavenderia fasciculata]|uniref:Uncharacterized protein n=1 Tax=Cavenderia fasciculata TaxID=261658 RepID=F4PIY1_CACFS|nr:uncharacterized protein DFA_06417 [Cavenderia fasciculata]EGG24267.1 hypothetical protein DFA_06417 [Cavenderia fasciculata]|eukprot:XP_004362118.1 hypothetical protein DFA_06417 [Cavenderia fasciculata]
MSHHNDRLSLDVHPHHHHHHHSLTPPIYLLKLHSIYLISRRLNLDINFSQPQALQYFITTQPGVYNYAILRLSDGTTLDNSTFTAPYFNPWGYLSTNDTDNVLILGSAPQVGLQVKSYSVQTNSLTNVYDGQSQYSFSFKIQPIVWDPVSLVASVAGLSMANEYGALAIIQFGFGQQTPKSAINLGVQGGTFNTAPIGAYDGSNYYYIYYNMGATIGLVKYSFKDYTFSKTVLNQEGGDIVGSQSLFFYNNQIYLASVYSKVGVTISTINYQTGDIAIIYSDSNIKKGFTQTIQTFVFDQDTGSIIILNVENDNLYVDIFDVTTETVTSSILDNTIPPNTNTIAVSTYTIPSASFSN